MTPTQTFVAAVLTAVLTSSAWPYFGPKIVEWKNRKKTAAETQQREAEARRERQRDEWMRDAEKAYQRVSRECSDCKKHLEEATRQHRKELDQLRRELGEVKDALLNRIEALDEILPYITNLPAEKVAELRAANRAHRQAVFRGRL